MVPLDNTRCERTTESFFVILCKKLFLTRKVSVCKREGKEENTAVQNSTEPTGSLPRMQLVLADRGNDRGSRLKKGCHKPCTHQDFSSPAANEKTHRHTKKKNNRDVCVFNTAFTPSAVPLAGSTVTYSFSVSVTYFMVRRAPRLG